MAPLFEASKRVVLTSPSLSLPELLRCLGLGVSKVERAEQILSELRKQGYLEVGGNSWWKAEVLAVMMSDSLDGETDHIRIQRVLASESLTIYKVHVERSEEVHKPRSVSSGNQRRLRCASPSVHTAAIPSAAAPSTQVQSGIPALEPMSGGVVASAPLRPQHALGHLITKHPKIMSNISTVLITVGGIACLPGFANCVTNTLLAHPAVTFTGGIAISVGNWLKAVVHSATANDGTRAQPRNQAAV